MIKSTSIKDIKDKLQQKKPNTTSKPKEVSKTKIESKSPNINKKNNKPVKDKDITLVKGKSITLPKSESKKDIKSKEIDKEITAMTLEDKDFDLRFKCLSVYDDLISKINGTSLVANHYSEFRRKFLWNLRKNNGSNLIARLLVNNAFRQEYLSAHALTEKELIQILHDVVTENMLTEYLDHKVYNEIINALIEINE